MIAWTESKCNTRANLKLTGEVHTNESINKAVEISAHT